MWLGASEWLAGGASEIAYLGASGRLGASATSSWNAPIGASGQPDAAPADGRSDRPGETWGGRLEGAGT
jgi:hypothetical protein